MHDIKKEVLLYLEWCKEHNLKPSRGESLKKYFKALTR